MLSTAQCRVVVGLMSRNPSVVMAVSVVDQALPNVLGTLCVFASTSRLAGPSTSKSMRKLKKCWWFGAEMFGDTVPPKRSSVPLVAMPRFSVVPVAPTRTSMLPSSRNT